MELGCYNVQWCISVLVPITYLYFHVFFFPTASNILICRSGSCQCADIFCCECPLESKCEIRISDFDSVKLFSRGLSATSVPDVACKAKADTTKVLGTPYYRAPEVIKHLVYTRTYMYTLTHMCMHCTCTPTHISTRTCMACGGLATWSRMERTIIMSIEVTLYIFSLWIQCTLFLDLPNTSIYVHTGMCYTRSNSSRCVDSGWAAWRVLRVRGVTCGRLGSSSHSSASANREQWREKR